jgi:hypothetical protein
MAIERRNYASGTYLEVTYPWGVYVGGAALCPDGIVRRLKRIARTADTLFSIPASVTFKGKTIAGYVTFENDIGTSTEDKEHPHYVSFRPYTYRQNGSLF